MTWKTAKLPLETEPVARDNTHDLNIETWSPNFRRALPN